MTLEEQQRSLAWISKELEELPKRLAQQIFEEGLKCADSPDGFSSDVHSALGISLEAASE